MPRYSDDYPLHQAAASGDAHQVRELLGSGVNVDSRSRLDETPLMAAVRSAQLEVVQVIVAAKAKLDARDKANRIEEGGHTALHMAVRFSYLRIAKALLDAGATVDPVNQRGKTPLVYACYNGNLDMARLLLDHGANPNGCDKRCASPLIAAATVSTAARAEKRPERHESALHLAIELLKRGANPNLQAGGESPLHAALSEDFARSLLAEGADVNQRNSNGETPLIVWAQAGSNELLRCYVEAGADINAKSNVGETALMRFFDRRPPEIDTLKMLVEAGADVNAVCPGDLSLLDHYVWNLDHLLRARSSDAMRVRHSTDDFADERSFLVQFLKAHGAKSRLEDRSPSNGDNRPP